MHVDATRSQYLGIADLFSPKLGVTAIGCTMTFRYYMGGSKQSGITMVLVGEFKGKRDYEVGWRRISDQKNDWVTATVAIGSFVVLLVRFGF